MSEIISAYSQKLINSLLLAIVLLGGYLLTKFILTRKIKIKKMRGRYVTRFKYLFFISFMVFFITIWGEAFLQILAFFGFLAAAFTLTQKDNLMNLIGWLVINWRGLFSEDDFIKISNYGGYVKSIGFLYFTLAEANADFPEYGSGRVIKIPNGLVARNPVTNYSHEKLVEHTLNFIFKPKGGFEAIEALFLQLKREMLDYLNLQPTFARLKLEKNETLESFEPKYYIKIRQEKPAGYEFYFLFYCRHEDKTKVQSLINKFVIDHTGQHEELMLAFD